MSEKRAAVSLFLPAAFSSSSFNHNSQRTHFQRYILCDSESSLHSQHFLEECWPLSETPWSIVIQVPEKWRKRPLTKNKDTKASRHFEENNYQGVDLQKNQKNA